MVGDADNACQVAVRLPQDRVGFMKRMLYTADVTKTLTHIQNLNDFSLFSYSHPW